MKPSLTICIVTSRKNSGVDWLIDSISMEMPEAKILIIDFWAGDPKPCVWQGQHRLTKDHWWAVSNARNTALCQCKTDWVMFLDDRGVLLPGFSQAVKDAIAGNYIMCGAYQKRIGMTVENGVIRHGGTITGEDGRKEYLEKTKLPNPFPAPGNWFYGCVNLLPLEWALSVNGWPEQCDGMGFEDVIMGMILENNGYPIRYDTRAMLVEDRTPDPSEIVFKRSAKERFPNDTEDKAHTMLRLVKNMRRSENPFRDIRELRQSIQDGNPFPITNQPTHDWFDNQPLASM